MPKIYLLFTFLCLSFHVKAQNHGNELLLNFIDSRILEHEAHINEIPPTPKTSILPINFLFLVYREVISEQISADCAFNLSCSRFSAGCIKQHGLIKGILLTGDRLTRCHIYIANETVPVFFDNTSGKVIDDPDFY